MLAPTLGIKGGHATHNVKMDRPGRPVILVGCRGESVTVRHAGLRLAALSGADEGVRPYIPRTNVVAAQSTRAKALQY